MWATWHLFEPHTVLEKCSSRSSFSPSRCRQVSVLGASFTPHEGLGPPSWRRWQAFRGPTARAIDLPPATGLRHAGRPAFRHADRNPFPITPSHCSPFPPIASNPSIARAASAPAAMLLRGQECALLYIRRRASTRRARARALSLARPSDVPHKHISPLKAA